MHLVYVNKGQQSVLNFFTLNCVTYIRYVEDKPLYCSVYTFILHGCDNLELYFTFQKIVQRGMSFYFTFAHLAQGISIQIQLGMQTMQELKIIIERNIKCNSQSTAKRELP